MTIFEHVLPGCAPIPLAGYLKALGVLRLVAEQADENARGFWRDERFALKTRLSLDELVGFFACEWRPTPVVAPWNSGSGFWPKDNREGLDGITLSNLSRLATYRDAISDCKDLMGTRNLSEAPKEEEKADFIAALRARLADDACRWLDGAVALTMEGPRYPPILGTGGNDGRLDFSNNFMRRLVQIIAAGEGKNREMLRASLLAEPSPSLEKGAVGQFAPGAAGGVNAGIGFEVDSRVNPWDFVLTVEGALVFAAAAVRRHAQDRADTFSYPFSTRTVGAGTGVAALVDEAESRAEFWTPLWSRPVTLAEISHLMSEGRAVLDERGGRDGFDFARAATKLGFGTGIDGFIRHGFLMRSGKAFFATPLGRVRARENPKASLISELDRRGWLARARSACRDKNTPASLLGKGQDFDEALFRLAATNSHAAVQGVLIALGALLLEIARRPKLRENLPPPPRVSSQWMTEADDGSPEFALAASLASLDATTESFRLPFRRHLAPLSWPKGRESWSDETEAHAVTVWSGRDLTRDMAVVLERRLIEAERREFRKQDGGSELPLRGARFAPLAAVRAFLGGRLDEGRIATLAAGLAWVGPGGFSSIANEHGDALPFAYVALKPLFEPDGVGLAEMNDKKRIDPLPLVRLIRARRVDDATWRAQFLARGAGLAAPFASLRPTAPLDPNRLTAALLFPIAPESCEQLIARAYPDVRKDKEEETHAD